MVPWASWVSLEVAAISLRLAGQLVSAVSAAVVSAGLRQQLFGLRRRLRRTE